MECENCVVRLDSNYTYQILKGGVNAGQGKWDIGTAIDIPAYLLHIENGPGYVVPHSRKIIDYISRINCCIKGCETNIADGFSGGIVRIDSTRSHIGQPTIFIKRLKGDTIIYYPKYFDHPWIKDKISVGDQITKLEKTMNFRILKKNGDSAILNYEIPDCNACK